MRRFLAGVLVALVAVVAGYYSYRWMEREDALATAASDLLRLRLPDQFGKEQEFGQWNNRILVVNFWATWCEPCRDEIPDLIRIRSKYAAKNLQVVGIAIDSADKVRQFAEEFRIEYPIMIGGMRVLDVVQRLGNKAGGLPYTVVLDPAGRIVATRLGRISASQLEAAVQRASD